METLDPQTLSLAVVVTGLGGAMIWLAARLNMLEQRQERRCPACGIIRRRGSCGCCR